MSHPGSVVAPAAALRGPDDALSRASIGIVPIIWNNADLPDLVPAVPTKLAELHAAEGEVLVAALGLSPGRVERAGHAAATDTPRLSGEAWAALAEILDTLGREAREQGHRVAFHQHAGTFVETPDEFDRLVELSSRSWRGCSRRGCSCRRLRRSG